MKSLADQIGGKCVHFSGINGENSACRAGVIYATVRGEKIPGLAGYPCFREGEAVPCDKRRFPTREEVDANVAERKAYWNQLKLGIGAAADDAKKHGFKKGNGGCGSLPCPVCKTGTLRYSVANCNGHMHGRCSTNGCVAWMQ